LDVSIIIPCYSLHVAHLTKCLASLSHGSGAFEVIVVLNGGDVPPIKENEHVHCISVKSRLHPSQARNIGARAARGRWLHFLDSDCQVTDTFFSSLYEAVKEDLPVVTGRILPENKNNSYSVYEWEIEASDKYKYRKNGRILSKIVSGANFLKKKELFFDIGMFCEDLPSGEDRDLGARLLKKGVEIVYCEALTVYHPFAQSLKEAVQRRLWHGKGGGMIYFFHPDVFERPFVNALQFIGRGTREVARGRRPVQYAVYTAVVGSVYYSIALFWYSVLFVRQKTSVKKTEKDVTT
jgi:GT2 family glycosyltransferase